MDERLVANLEEFNRRYAFPRLVPGRAEDFFREVERRWGATLPVRRGESGTQRVECAPSTGAQAARSLVAPLATRAPVLLAAGVEKTHATDGGAAGRIAQR